jgi:hypothetical protein
MSPRIEDKTIFSRVRTAMTTLPANQAGMKQTMEQMIKQRQNQQPKQNTKGQPLNARPAINTNT